MATPSAVSGSASTGSSDPMSVFNEGLSQALKAVGTTTSISSSGASGSITPAVVPTMPAMPSTADLMARTTAVAGALQKQTTDAFTANVKAAIPGYDQIIAGLTANAQEMLTGALPKDVQEQINMSAAQKNIQGGLFGGIAANRGARDIGKTSLDMMIQGRTGLENVLNIASKYVAPTVDAASLYNASQQADLQRASLMQKYDEMGVQNSQFYADLGIKQSQLAIQSSELGLRAAQTALDKYKYDSSLSWDKELSNLNRQFEVWSLNQQKSLMKQQQASALALQSEKDSSNERMIAAFTNASGSGSASSFGYGGGGNDSASGSAAAMANAQRLNPGMSY